MYTYTHTHTRMQLIQIASILCADIHLWCWIFRVHFHYHLCIIIIVKVNVCLFGLRVMQPNTNTLERAHELKNIRISIQIASFDIHERLCIHFGYISVVEMFQISECTSCPNGS